MTEILSLNGRRCRASGRTTASTGYYYTVVASFLDPSGVLQCAVINRTGGTNVLRFIELDFDPDQAEVRPIH